MCTIGLELGQSLARMGVAIDGFDKVNRCAQHEADYRTRARPRP